MTPPSMPEGEITDPHTAYIVASYGLAAAALIGLTVFSLWQARRWAQRAKAAAAQEAAQKAQTAP